MYHTNVLVLVTFLIILIARVSSSPMHSDEDSGSIELPNRPENRQEHKALTKSTNQDPKTFLQMLSKVMDGVKHTLQNKSKKVGKEMTFKGAVNRARKALAGLNKAHVHVEKAKKQMRGLLRYNSRRKA